MTDTACYRLEGRVSFDNLVQLRREGEAALAQAADPAVMDLSGLSHGNSAAVALLMAWFREAEHHDKTVRFVHVPEEVKNIIELSGMSDVLPLADAEEGQNQ